MDTYTVRLTTEGESVEQDVLADDCLHAARQALAVWHRIAPGDTAVLSMWRLETEAKRQERVDQLEACPELGVPPAPAPGGRPQAEVDGARCGNCGEWAPLGEWVEQRCGVCLVRGVGRRERRRLNVVSVAA